MKFELVGKATHQHIDGEGKITTSIEIKRAYFSDNIWVDGVIKLGDRVVITLDDGRERLDD